MTDNKPSEATQQAKPKAERLAVASSALVLAIGLHSNGAVFSILLFHFSVKSDRLLALGLRSRRGPRFRHPLSPPEPGCCCPRAQPAHHAPLTEPS